MITVIHNKCGKPAFYFKEKLSSGDRVLAKNVVLLDGSAAIPNSRAVCGSCHGEIAFTAGELEQVDQHWSDWFVLEEDKWRLNR